MVLVGLSYSERTDNCHSCSMDDDSLSYTDSKTHNINTKVNVMGPWFQNLYKYFPFVFVFVFVFVCVCVFVYGIWHLVNRRVVGK